MTDYTEDDTIDHDRMMQWGMASKLPYTLTKGVTATLHGIKVDPDGAPDAWSMVAEWDCAAPLHTALEGPWLVPWQYAADRLRYREGENYCFLVHHYASDESIVCETPPGPVGQSLHRLATILCDDAEAFRVLHWCIYNLTGANPVEFDGITPDQEDK